MSLHVTHHCEYHFSIYILELLSQLQGSVESDTDCLGSNSHRLRHWRHSSCLKLHAARAGRACYKHSTRAACGVSLLHMNSFVSCRMPWSKCIQMQIDPSAVRTQSYYYGQLVLMASLAHTCSNSNAHYALEGHDVVEDGEEESRPVKMTGSSG